MHSDDLCLHVRTLLKCVEEFDFDWSHYLTGLSMEIIPILIGVIGAMWLYHKQKQYDLIRQRYLDNGIDQASSALSQLLSSSRSNWAHLLHILHRHQALGSNFDVAELDKGFISLDSGQLQPIANQRIHYLVDNDAIWNCFQKAMVAFGTIDEFMRADANSALKQHIPANQAIYDGILAELDKIDKKHNYISTLVAAIEGLAEEFQKQRYDFKRLKKFGKKKVVIEYLQIIEKVSQKLTN